MALPIEIAIRPHNKNAGITNWLFRSRYGGAPDLGAADFGAPNLSLSAVEGGVRQVEVSCPCRFQLVTQAAHFESGVLHFQTSCFHVVQLSGRGKLMRY